MKRLLAAVLKDGSAVTSIEYSLIACGVALAIVIGTGSLGSKLGNTFSDMSTNFKGK
ncbi:MAG: Flp family type IVb pilin [Bauldia sp.]